jgi:hypothetical protein
MVMGSNAGFLRDEALLLLVFVSDENDCSDEGALAEKPASACYDERDLLVPTENYVATFQALKDDPGMVRVGAIVGPKASEGGCEDASPGLRYMEVANRMTGLVGDICEAEYDEILYNLGLYAVGIVTEFHLSAPAQPDSIHAYVADSDGTEWEVNAGELYGWTYDRNGSTVTFHGEAIPPRGSMLTVEYQLESR